MNVPRSARSLDNLLILTRTYHQIPHERVLLWYLHQRLVSRRQTLQYYYYYLISYLILKGMVDQAPHESDSQHFQNERASVFAINRPGVSWGTFGTSTSTPCSSGLFAVMVLFRLLNVHKQVIKDTQIDLCPMDATHLEEEGFM
jgi:hypothetical protein